jgi:endonuclease G
MRTSLLAAVLAAACALAASNSRTELPQAPTPAKPAPTSTAAASAANPVTGFNACRQFFPGELPRVPDLQARKPRDLCFDAFAILYSGRSKTPVFGVERLTAAQLADASDEVRTNKFFADSRLPSVECATLEDFKGYGYDRGHVVPAGDQPTAQAIAQSFSLREHGTPSTEKQPRALG